ncbi:MAG: hypothetical protein NTY60_07750 [Proteobacteria bacterium]|nr:hypothetical protein [Pseudomonadota bacterium]
MNRIIIFVLCALAGLLFSAGIHAATCTSKATGSWNSTGTWTCTGTPAATIPGAADAAIVASPNTVTLTAAASVTSLTYGTTPSIAAGSTLTFAGTATIYAGRNGSTTVTGSVLTINGTLVSTQAAGIKLLYLYANSTVIGSAGVINAANSVITYSASTATVSNNGAVTAQKITQKSTTNKWTQGANSSLTLTAVSTLGVLTASATGNTVTYTSPATPITPAGNTYYNLAGTGVSCPTAYTILGSSPCAVIPGLVMVTMNPGSCANATGIGTVAWAPTPTANVNLSDTLYATATVSGTTNYLTCTGYNFAIPATATILGIAVNVTRKSSSTTSSTDGAMRLVKAGVIGTVDRSKTTVYTTADVIEGHGTSADLWGVAWLPSDINSAAFGAAFAAKTTNSRTISVNYMPITVAYTMPAAAPHHIQIEHSGAGKTCAPELLTVKACADAACASNFTTANVTGNVTWAGSPGGTLPFTIASGGTGQATVSLSVGTAQTVTLGTSSVAPTPTAGNGCTNLAGGTACSLPFAASSLCLDAVEVGAAIATPINLKLSGTPFSLDVKTSAPFTGTVQVELVDASAGSCSTYTQLNTQSVSFNAVNQKTVNFTYANASRNTRVRMTSSGSASCSADAFVIRPLGLTVTSTANADSAGASKTATPAVKTGANFTLTASAIAGYDGTPVVDNTLLAAHTGAIVSGHIGGVFTAANTATGVATGSAFTYDEVGYFKFNVNGVSDKSFANLDILDGECTADFSNTLAGGKYGCYFGNTAASNYFGRFIPDHFETVVADECNGFTYSGQPFALEVSARDASGGVTQNYDGTFSKAVILSDALDLPPLQGAFTPSTVAAGSFASGLMTMRPSYAFTAVKTANTLVGVRAAEVVGNDSVSSASPATPVEGQTEIRSGRVWMSNAYGSELLDLTVPVFAQYYDGSSFVINDLDDVATCTSFIKPTATLLPGGAALTVTMNPDPAIAGNVGFAAGNGSLVLTRSGVAGYADVILAVPAWLQFAWRGAGLTNPSGRATFGVYGGNPVFIYRGRRGH